MDGLGSVFVGAAAFGSAADEDELLLSCASGFSIKDRGLLGASILMVGFGLIGTARRTCFSIVGWALRIGPLGDKGPSPPRAAIPSVADCDLSLAGLSDLPAEGSKGQYKYPHVAENDDLPVFGFRLSRCLWVQLGLYPKIARKLASHFPTHVKNVLVLWVQN